VAIGRLHRIGTEPRSPRTGLRILSRRGSSPTRRFSICLVHTSSIFASMVPGRAFISCAYSLQALGYRDLGGRSKQANHSLPGTFICCSLLVCCLEDQCRSMTFRAVCFCRPEPLRCVAKSLRPERTSTVSFSNVSAGWFRHLGPKVTASMPRVVPLRLTLQVLSRLASWHSRGLHDSSGMKGILPPGIW
jgi:hypothetical protein